MKNETSSRSVGLRWTGNSVIDMGIAAVVVDVEADSPEEVTIEQWMQVMYRLETDYIDGLFRKPSMILLTNNTFENPSFSKNPEGRTAKLKEAFEHARGEHPPLKEACTFFSERPAVIRAARGEYPLLQGNNQLNFYTNGTAEITLSDLAYGCVLALPLACPIVSGRFMVIAADDVELFLDLCDGWYQDLAADRSLFRLDGTVVERKAPRTRLFDTLSQVYREVNRQLKPMKSSSYTGLTLYHLSNSGNGPAIDIYSMPPHVLNFFRRAQAAAYQSLYRALVRAFWRNQKGKIKGEEPTDDERRLVKNDLYEMAVSLPAESPTFIRRFFQNYVYNRVGFRNRLNVGDKELWPLLELFLTEVMHMQNERIEKICEIADELALEIKGNNDKRLLKNIMGVTSGTADYYYAFRRILLRAMRVRLKRKNELLMTLDDYLLVFEEGEEYPKSDWRLARDLIRIRCLEKLHEMNYFGEVPDSLEIDEDELESASE